MARRFRGGSRPLGRGARLRKTWCRVEQVGIGVGTNQAEMMGCVAAEASGLETTILRTRGHYMLTGTPDAVTDSDVLALGIAVVPETSRAIGGLSLPGPIADINSDIWLWWAGIPLDALTLTGADPQSITTNFRGEIDSKGMRKMPSDSAVVLMAELSAGTFASVFFTGSVQFLLGT